MDIQKLVYGMLSTSTWEAMWDSGSAYGRHWERNIKKTLSDWQNEPEVSFEITHCIYWENKETEYKNENGINHTYYYYDAKEDRENHSEYNYTISVFHYMCKLDLDEVCEEYNRKKCPDWESDIHGVSKSQRAWLDKKGFVIGDSFNTYNHDSNLSQVLQWTIIDLDDKKYVLLQVHQGCDVRGGYTDAKMFLLPDDYMPMESVYWKVTEKDGTEYSVSNWYDGYRLRYDDDSENPLHEKEIFPENITSVSLSIS